MSRSRLSLWKRGAEYLKAKGVPEYSHDSRELLLSTAEISLEELYIDGEEEVSQDSIKKYSDALIRRGNREPLQYITGRTEFMGLPFILRPGVLIPRQDTEILTEAVLDAAKEHPLRSVLELCTGSGCIAVALNRIGGLTVAASDISEAALALAAENARANGADIELLQSDIYSGIYSSRVFDAIAANPPYIPSGEIPGLMPEVRDFEPLSALDGGPDGLTFYRKILSGAPLKAGGFIFLEIGYNQGEDVKELLLAAGFGGIEIKKDLSGLDRVIYGKKREV